MKSEKLTGAYTLIEGFVCLWFVLFLVILTTIYLLQGLFIHDVVSAKFARWRVEEVSLELLIEEMNHVVKAMPRNKEQLH